MAAMLTYLMLLAFGTAVCQANLEDAVKQGLHNAVDDINDGLRDAAYDANRALDQGVRTVHYITSSSDHRVTVDEAQMAVGLIVAIVVAALVGLVLVIALLVCLCSCCCRRRRHTTVVTSSNSYHPLVEPYMTSVQKV